MFTPHYLHPKHDDIFDTPLMTFDSDGYRPSDSCVPSGRAGEHVR